MTSNLRNVPTDPHRVPIERLWDRLATSADGLSAAEAGERLLHEGPNVLSEARRLPVVLRFGRHLIHPFALLLWAGALLALLGEWFSPGEGTALIAGALVCVVLLNGAFSFWQELRVERAMAAFREMLSPRARAVRDGVECDIEAADAVVGDVLVLREGDRVAADARLFQSCALKVDNAPLTGESEPQLRTTELAAGACLAARNLVFAGTLVTSGTGAAVVYATGDHTEIGKIADVTRKTERIETPIRRELRHFIRTISGIAITLGLVFFVTGWSIGNPFWTNLVFAIGIIVANVPEGLLPTVTLALALAGRKMARRMALLKTLESAETLGSTTVICTDKTGTLTENEMRVSEVLLGVDGDTTECDPASARRALRTMALCNNATLVRDKNELRITGDPTETALLRYVESVAPGGVDALRADHRRIHEHPFDSTTKEMATIHTTPRGLEALLKGAPEVVVDQCSHVLHDGASVPLDRQGAAEFRRTADEHARHGRRVLALASKLVDSGLDLESEAAGGGYALIGLVAMHDPPRPEVAAAVARCRRAGIRVVVISGDHPLTVEAIARQVGVVGGDAPAIYTGAQLAGWSRAALRRALGADEILFARTSPLDKMHIVSALQQMGQVVAVTGDGVNDAPALKRADIGVAMGKSGTDVAREAADMVLMDDNFTTIVAAVEEGRVIYGNIRRFIGYVLTSNVPEILPYIAFVLLSIPLPLPVLLILAIDLGTDIAPAVALATEPAERDVMDLPPRPRTERLLSRGVLLAGYGLWGPIETAAGFAGYFWVLSAGNWTVGVELAASDRLYQQAIAAFFAAVVLCQVANVFVWRTTRQSVFAKGLLRNRAVLVGVLVELALLALIIETRVGHAAMRTASPPAAALLVVLPIALAMLGMAELIKAISRRRAQQREADSGAWVSPRAPAG